MIKLCSKSAAVIVVTVLLLSLTAVRTSADDAYLMFDFSSDTGAFKSGDNTKETNVGSFDFESNGKTVSRDCLEVVSYDLSVGLIRTTAAVFDTPFDLSDYRTLSYEIYAAQYEKDPYASYYTRITLYSGDGTSVENIVQIPCGVWTDAEIDIGSWSGRHDITGAEIALIISTTVKDFYSSSFFIDNITAEDKVDRELTDRFLFDIFTPDGGNAYFSEDKNLFTIELSQTDVTNIDAEVILPELDQSVNSLRFNLTNNSDIDTLVLYYSTFDTEVLSEYKSVTLNLEKSSDSAYYYADIGDASKLKSIKIRLGSGDGNIEISSICAVSEYRRTEYSVCGSITSCRLSSDLQSVRFTGEISRDEALSNQDGKIAIYALDSDGNLDLTALSSQVPLVTSPMSTKFDISYSITKSSGALISRRMAAVMAAADGTMTLIAPPFYIENPEAAATVSLSSDFGKKGVVSGDLSLIGESGADVTLLELDVSSVFTAKNGAERYLYNDCVYYIDGNYISVTDAKITALYGAGINILLRLSNWNDMLAASLDASYAADDYVDFSNYGSQPDGSDYFAALMAYIAEKWCVSGSISGVVIGNCVNFTDTYNSDGSSLNEIAAESAEQLRTAYTTLISSNSDAKVYISLSDLYSTEYATGSKEIGLDEFIPAIYAETSQYGNFDWGICVDSFYRIGGVSGVNINVSECSRLSSLLHNLGLDETRLIFCDSTFSFPKLKLSDLTAEAVRGYYGAVFNDDIDCFIISLGSGENSDYLVQTVKLLDTELAGSVSDLALKTLGASDWSDLIRNYDEEKLIVKSYTSSDASEDMPSDVKGIYSYYSFDSFSGVSSFMKGYYCSALNIKGGGSSTLRATLSSNAYGSPGSKALMGIAQRFEYPENLTLTPVLAVTLGIDEVSPSNVTELTAKLVLTARDERFESDITLTAGKTKTVYIDLSDFGMADDTEGIMLLVNSSDISSAVLSVESIKGLSFEYNDESLESVIADERERKRSPDTTHSYGVYIWIGAGITVCVATIITFVLLSRRKSDPNE